MHTITVGARNSPLSQVQVKEVWEELRAFYPSIRFEPVFMASTGDKDLKTSLRTLDKTDFFTREIDELVLKGMCRIGIHSAKDLPEPLPKGLVMAALTRGVDPADVLVIRPGESIESLPSGAVIATSSERREQAVKQMRPDLRFIDLRGTIGQRLEKLDKGEADGVVVAEAALIRLGLTHLNRVVIPGETVRYQGQLAIIAREEDQGIIDLFRCLDCRQADSPVVLYLGLKLPENRDQRYVHYPIINIQPRALAQAEVQQMYHGLPAFTHAVFTSKSSVTIFFEYLQLSRYGLEALKDLQLIAVGKATAALIERLGGKVSVCAQKECAEGIIEVLESLDLSCAYILWPHSSLSRPLLRDYFLQKHIRFYECNLYDTVLNRDYPQPNLDKIEEIVFTSPSCVDAYMQIIGDLPVDKKWICQGPVTQAHLNRVVGQIGTQTCYLV